MVGCAAIKPVVLLRGEVEHADKPLASGQRNQGNRGPHQGQRVFPEHKAGGGHLGLLNVLEAFGNGTQQGCLNANFGQNSSCGGP